MGVPIHLHTHNTTGTGDMTNLMAAQAGVDIVDTALSPLANGTSPARDRGHGGHPSEYQPRYRPGYGQKLSEAAAHFRGVAERSWISTPRS